MIEKGLEFSSFWDKRYLSGYAQSYPWDSVVSFIFRNAPKDLPRSEIKVLEVGFGTGPNLWFAAREGFRTAGVESSITAVEIARKRFRQDKLEGDLLLGDFTNLPFEDETFDLAIDRCSLVCVGANAQKKAVSEVQRCLRVGGLFFHNAYTDCHSSMQTGEQGPDRITMNIEGGALQDNGPLFFTSRNEINERFKDGWLLSKVERREYFDALNAGGGLHSEWLVVAEKR